MSHTPGPWTVEIEEYEERSGTITIPQINRVLHDPEWAKPEDWDLDVANARLIAAAPDLLEALKLMVKSAVPHPVEHPTMTATWKVAEAVIAKAEGRS